MRVACLILLLLIFSACGIMQNRNDSHVEFSEFLKQKVDERDSLFVLHTVKELSLLDWFTFSNYSKLYNMSNDEVEYFIGGVFYNPHKTKMIVWIGEKMPNANFIGHYSEEATNRRICPVSGDVVHSMTSLIGIRDCEEEMWKLYPLNNQQAVCYDSKMEVTNVLGTYFFQEMESHSEYVLKEFLDAEYGGKVRYDLEKHMHDLGYGQGDTTVILKNYGYNLQDHLFWDKSLLWQKGAKVTGYYNFQLYGKAPWKIPAIEYPEAITKLYTECR